MSESTAEKLVELAKRRGFFFPSAGAYGGVAGFYTFGPQGAALKQNVEDAWRERFAVREGHQEIDAPTVMPEPVFEASGHLDGFDDMLVECADCGESHRADHLIEDNTAIEEAESIPIEEVEELIDEHQLVCPSCGADLSGEPVDDFNLMFGTNIGPGDSSPGYLRPETAQGIFVEFPLLKEYARNQLPFGVTQIGKAYRNEISPRKSVIRTREFTQAELELFVDPEGEGPDLSRVEDVEVRLYPIGEQEESEARRASEEASGDGEEPRADDGELIETTIGAAVEDGTLASPWIAYYLGVAQEWYERVGVDADRFRFRQHLSGERAHYASDCWDAEAELDEDWIELAGFAYRGDYDLSKHAEHSDEEFTIFKQYDEPVTVERATVDPDMSYLGPEFGGQAQAVADALESLAEEDRSAFESAERRQQKSEISASPETRSVSEDSAETSSGDEPRDGAEVAVEVEGEEYTVPVEKTGFSVDEVTEAGEHITPHVVEPSFGVDRLLYTILDHAYAEDEVGGEERTYLSLDAEVAPTTVGVFPLMDKEGLGERARDLAAELRAAGLSVNYDDSGAIGRRYRRQDEIGTPFCVTVDYETLEDGTVTVRERDSTEQLRVPVEDLDETLTALSEGALAFADADGEPVAED